MLLKLLSVDSFVVAHSLVWVMNLPTMLRLRVLNKACYDFVMIEPLLWYRRKVELWSDRGVRVLLDVAEKLIKNVNLVGTIPYGIPEVVRNPLHAEHCAIDPGAGVVVDSLKVLGAEH